MSYNPLPVPMPIPIPYPVDSYGGSNISPKEMGILLILTTLWFAGLFYAGLKSADKWDNPLIGIFLYLIATGIILILL